MLLELNDNIKVYYITWIAVGCTEQKCDSINEYKLDGNKEVVLVGTSHHGFLILLDSTMIGVSDSSKVGE